MTAHPDDIERAARALAVADGEFESLWRVYRKAAIAVLDAISDPIAARALRNAADRLRTEDKTTDGIYADLLDEWAADLDATCRNEHKSSHDANVPKTTH